MINLGTVRPGSTLYFPFESFASSTGAPITLTGLATSDIKVYKDGGTTQRASASGFTLLDTDGIDFDAITGIHGFSIDLSDNTTADFWASGSRYFVVVDAVTVDSQTMSFVVGHFRIGHNEAVLDTTIATLASQTSFTLTAGSADNNAYIGCVVVIYDAASAVQLCMGVISAYTGATKTVTLAADPGIFTIAAKDNISILPRTNVHSFGGASQSSRDIGASVLLSSGTSTGQLDFTSGVVKANATQINAVSTSSVTTVNANVGTTQPINFTGTGASALAKSDMVDVAGAAVSTSTAQLGVNAVQAGGTAWGSGAITAASIAADAITAAKVADGTIDAATFAAGAINAAAVADGTIDRATFAADTGLQSARSNTAQSGGATSITLDASASATTDFYVGAWIVLTGGTGVGQARVCTAYNGTSKAATVAPAWATNPDVTSTFAVMMAAHVAGVQGNVTGSVASVTGAVGSVTGNVGGNVVGSVASVTGNVGGNVTGSVGSVAAGGIAAASFAAGAIDATAIASNAIAAAKIATGAITSAKFAAGAIDAAAIATDAIDADALAADAVTEIQSGLSTLTAAGVRTAVGLASANLDTQLDALPTATENADAMLKRDMSAVSGESDRSPLNALRFLRNKWSVAAGTLTVTKEDDTTTAWTSAVTGTTGADPITASDPA